ncbi:MAG: DUF559 domain-containing protein [Dongiaceae bacterium]
MSEQPLEQGGSHSPYALEDHSRFRELVAAHIDRAIAANESGDAHFRRFRRKAMALIARRTVRAIADAAQSPIETVFIQALVLRFLEADGLGLFVHPTIRDTRREIAEFRRQLSDSRALQTWFSDYRPKDGLRHLVDEEHTTGRMSLEEWRDFLSLLARYHASPLDGSYHMTLQPRFPDIRIGDKSIRPDLYFWIPKQPDINVIVECDGFAFHSDPEKFERDRKRDRALQDCGYDVLRFAGSEINRDSRAVADELARFLLKRAAVADTAYTNAQSRQGPDRPGM